MHILFIFIGSFLILLGGLIWLFKMIDLVINESDVTDRNAYARWLGINYILMGAFIILFSLLTIDIYPLKESGKVFGLTAIMGVFFMILYFGGKKYLKN